MNDTIVRTSKLLSFVLRHRPEEIGIELDPSGWVAVPALLEALAVNGHDISLAELEIVVKENDKQRFTIKNGLIRANQGHSISISLGLEPRTPPDYLYHGTTTKFLAAILQTGLQKMRRHHVHLSLDTATAQRVGMRHGEPTVLKVQSSAMHRNGQEFFLSDNGVWLTDSVAPQYIEVIHRDRSATSSHGNSLAE